MFRKLKATTKKKYEEFRSSTFEILSRKYPERRRPTKKKETLGNVSLNKKT